MLTINYHTSFKKDYKRIIKRGYKVNLFEKVLDYLVNEIPLPTPLSVIFSPSHMINIEPAARIMVI